MSASDPERTIDGQVCCIAEQALFFNDVVGYDPLRERSTLLRCSRVGSASSSRCHVVARRAQHRRNGRLTGYRHNECASHTAELADSPSDYCVSFWRWQRGRCFGTNLRAAPLRSFVPTSNLRKCQRREMEKGALIKAANMTVE